jgi:DNA-nicking Smr family endonuclease
MTQDPIPEYPITDTLDLHTFNPRDVKELIPEYLSECRKCGILTVRIIHGKGTGTLREMVHAILANNSDVMEFHLATDSSHWGATIAVLRV